MKTIIVAAGILIASVAAQAQTVKRSDFFKPYGKSFVTSSAVYWTGFAADLSSSQGSYELNPVFRGSGGRVNNKRALLIAGSGYAVSVLIEKQHPKLASVLRFIGGSVHWGAAARNWRQ